MKLICVSRWRDPSGRVLEPGDVYEAAPGSGLDMSRHFVEAPAPLPAPAPGRPSEQAPLVPPGSTHVALRRFRHPAAAEARRVVEPGDYVELSDTDAAKLGSAMVAELAAPKPTPQPAAAKVVASAPAPEPEPVQESPPPEAADTGEDPDLESMDKSELRAFAKEHGLQVDGRMAAESMREAILEQLTASS